LSRPDPEAAGVAGAALDPELRAEIRAALAEAVRLGLIGTGNLDEHIEHSVAMGRAAVRATGGVPERLLDLGSGGGLPGAVLAAQWRDCEVVLLDASTRRGAVLDRALTVLGAGRSRVVIGRAEALGHDPELRERFPVVTARAFGAPPVTAECATGFVAVAGVAVVAEPAGGAPDRWSDDGLASLGLRVERRSTDPALVVLRKVEAAPSARPRSVGRPAKRPLW
jgi:16S rRNA (guanine527-N7)-methyltransferase